MTNIIVDKFGRSFKTLRVSLNNTCNLACAYCVDESHKKRDKKNEQRSLSTRQYIQIIEVLHNILGLETIRLTGGEPTLYRELIPLINGIKKTGVEQIKMTTNATQLDAIALKNAGLTAVNISLDAIDSDVSLDISKRKKLQQILSGIDNAIEAGILVKINCVLMNGVNDHQLMKLLEFAKGKNVTIRFLELMQMGHLYHNFQQYFFSENEMLEVISSRYNITALTRDTNSTAKYWLTDDAYKFGIISNESDPFCNDCNRLRLDSYGNIYGCLSDNNGINILDSLNDENAIAEKLNHSLSQKKTRFSGSELSMLHIGG
jgi:cyclic pyranopterin phosphate synthase